MNCVFWNGLDLVFNVYRNKREEEMRQNEITLEQTTKTLALCTQKVRFAIYLSSFLCYCKGLGFLESELIHVIMVTTAID